MVAEKVGVRAATVAMRDCMNGLYAWVIVIVASGSSPPRNRMDDVVYSKDLSVDHSADAKHALADGTLRWYE